MCTSRKAHNLVNPNSPEGGGFTSNTMAVREDADVKHRRAESTPSRTAKSTINRGMDASLEAGLALEREAFSYCFCLPDAKEGIRAFLEKRKPVFR